MDFARVPHYFSRNTHSDTASPTAAATITSTSFQGNGYAVPVRFGLCATGLTAAGLTRTCDIALLGSVISKTETSVGSEGAAFVVVPVMIRKLCIMRKTIAPGGSSTPN